MPKRKVAVGLVAGAIVTLLLGAVQLFDPTIGNQITPVEAGAAVTLVSFALAYAIPEADQA